MYVSDLLKDIDISSLHPEEVKKLFTIVKKALPYELPPKLQNLDAITKRFVVMYGGRGGGKSEGLVRKLVEWVKEKKCICLCLREVQDTLKDSSIAIVQGIIKKFNQESEWKTAGRAITHKDGGSFIFYGMNERTNKDVGQNIKSIYNVKYCWIEEAQFLSEKSLSILTPSIRGGGDDIFSLFSEDVKNQIFFTMNIETDIDPVKEKFIDRKRADTEVININYCDNPFFPNELEKERIEDFKEAEELNDFDEYNHKWLGHPRAQEKTSLLLYSQFKEATENHITPVGAVFIGVDVARSGEDATIFYKRKGMTLIDKREYKFSEWGTRPIPLQADELEKFIGVENKDTFVNIDEGSMGAGLVDEMRARGYNNIFGIMFQSRAKNPDKYENAISEMSYEFVKAVTAGEVDICIEKNNAFLRADLCQRLRTITNSGKRGLEKKDDFKKRYGRSPDNGDALLLCYYNNALFMEIGEKARRQLAKRRATKKRRRLDV